MTQESAQPDVFSQLLKGLEGFRAPLTPDPAVHTRVRVVVTNDATPAAYFGMPGRPHVISRTAQTAWAFVDQVWMRPSAVRLRTEEIAEVISQSLTQLEQVNFYIENILLHVEDSTFLVELKPALSQGGILAGKANATVTDVSSVRR